MALDRCKTANFPLYLFMVIIKFLLQRSWTWCYKGDLAVVMVGSWLIECLWHLVSALFSHRVFLIVFLARVLAGNIYLAVDFTVLYIITLKHPITQNFLDIKFDGANKKVASLIKVNSDKFSKFLEITVTECRFSKITKWSFYVIT